MIIDWELAGTRSALYDVYDAIFRRLWGKPITRDVVVEVMKTVQNLQRRLAMHKTGDKWMVSSSFHAHEIYRWFYYLERICTYVVRREKLKESSLRRLRLYVETFVHYEEVARPMAV